MILSEYGPSLRRAGQGDRSSPDLAIHDFMNSHPLQKP